MPDLEDKGFTLVGGRLDVIDRRPVAAVVYRQRQRIINLYIAAARGSPGASRSEQIGGYNLVRWTEAGLTYSAVCDLNAAELRAFADLVRANDQ